MPGPVWKQPADQARAAADVMSSRALDRHPPVASTLGPPTFYNERHHVPAAVQALQAEVGNSAPELQAVADAEGASYAYPSGVASPGFPWKNLEGEFDNMFGLSQGYDTPLPSFEAADPIVRSTLGMVPLADTGLPYNLSDTTKDKYVPPYGDKAYLTSAASDALNELFKRFKDEHGIELDLESAFRNFQHDEAVGGEGKAHTEGIGTDISYYYQDSEGEWKELTKKQIKSLKSMAEKVGLKFRNYSEDSRHFDYAKTDADKRFLKHLRSGKDWDFADFPKEAPSALESILADTAAADVGMIEAVDAAKELVPPDFYDNPFHVPTAVQELQAEVGHPAPFYRDEIAGLPPAVRSLSKEDARRAAWQDQPFFHKPVEDEWGMRDAPISGFPGRSMLNRIARAPNEWAMGNFENEEQARAALALLSPFELRAYNQGLTYNQVQQAKHDQMLAGTDAQTIAHEELMTRAGARGSYPVDSYIAEQEALMPPTEVVRENIVETQVPDELVEDAPGARVAGPFIPYPTNVHPDAMVPPYWAGEQFPDIDRQYPVPTGQDDDVGQPRASSDYAIEGMIRDAERSGRSLDRRFAGMGEGPSGDIGRIPWDQPPAPSAEAVEAVEIYRSEAADELRDTLRAEGSNEAIALADQLDIEQRFGAGQDFDKSDFYFPEDEEQSLWDKIKGGVADAWNWRPDATVMGDSAYTDTMIEGQDAPEPRVQVVGDIGPQPLVAGAVEPAPTAPPQDYPREAGMDFAPPEAPSPLVAGESDPTLVGEPGLEGDAGPMNIEEAQTLEDWTAALYGEPPGVPQFPVVPYPGSPELTKMGFYAKDYKQSDLVNPPSEMIRNAFPWARDLPTDVLERAARDGEFFRSLMDMYGRPEGGGSWTNPDQVAPAQVAPPSPQVVGADIGVPPELAAEIAAAGEVPVEEVAVDTGVQNAQAISEARATLNDLISQLSWIQRMAIQGAGIDLDKFSGPFNRDDIAALYQFMLQNKDRVGPEIWAQIEAINEVLG